MLFNSKYQPKIGIMVRCIGGPKPPDVQPVNTVGQDANTALKASEAEKEEKEKLKTERGIAGTILTGPGGESSIKSTGKKRLLGE